MAEVHTTEAKKGSAIVRPGNDFVIYLLLCLQTQTNMNGDGSQKLFVSTFRMHIKPPNALSAQTSRLRIIDSRTPVKSPETGKTRKTSWKQ